MSSCLTKSSCSNMPSCPIFIRKQMISRNVKGKQGDTSKESQPSTRYFGYGATMACCTKTPTETVRINPSELTFTVHSIQVLSNAGFGEISQLLDIGCVSTYNAAIFTAENGFKLGYLRSYRDTSDTVHEWLSKVYACLDLFAFGGLDRRRQMVIPVHGIILTGHWNIENLFNKKTVKRPKTSALLTYVLKKYCLKPTSDSSRDYICFSSNLDHVKDEPVESDLPQTSPGPKRKMTKFEIRNFDEFHDIIEGSPLMASLATFEKRVNEAYLDLYNPKSLEMGFVRIESEQSKLDTIKVE